MPREIRFARWISGSRALVRANIAIHQEAGYYCAFLFIAYCVSGIALNHIDEWNPDFVVTKRQVALPEPYEQRELTRESLLQLSALVGESSYRIHDYPTPDQVKIYYDDASLHVDLSTGIGTYERVSRRPLFYQFNALHLNRLSGWRWVSDAFAGAMIVLTLTGLFVLRGRNGIGGRGKWLIAAGMLPAILALLLFEFE